MLTIVIGDIHGMAVKLENLLGQIDMWCVANAKAELRQLIFLGDYIDRGPNFAPSPPNRPTAPSRGCYLPSGQSRRAHASSDGIRKGPYKLSRQRRRCNHHLPVHTGRVSANARMDAGAPDQP